MEVTVIIPTYQGRKKIPVVLDALSKQTFRKFEVVIVVDGSTDGTEEYLRSQQGIDKIVVQNNGGRANARNSGVKAATGDLFIFYDDDMAPFPDSIARHYSFHRQYPGALCGGNPVEPVDVDKTDLQQYKEWVSEKWIRKYNPGIQRLHSDNLFFTGANSSFSKAVWTQLGGFNELLSDAEDYDFAYRALQLGIAVYFDKDNLAYHHDPITWRSYISRLREYRSANKKLNELSGNNPTLDRGNLLKRSVYRLLGTEPVLRMVENSRWIKLLPRAIRYRLYESILHSQSLKVE